METNRLDIDYKIIDRLNYIVDCINECIYRSEWDRKNELEKMYFNIYDQLDFTHKEYIETRKGREII